MVEMLLFSQATPYYFEGTVALQNCESLTNDQKKVVTAFVLKSMTEIIKAESVEVELWKKADVTPEEYFKVIRLKGVIAGLHCRIGGVFAGADEKMIEDLTNYGRLIGILSTLKEEFVDLVTPSELAHRIKNELPPYPMLYALQNPKIKEQFLPFVKENRISSKNLKFIAKTTLNSIEVQKLKAELRKLGENELASNLLLKDSKRAKELTILLEALSAEM